MKQERRQFDRAFKVMAVELCLSGKPTNQIAEELGIRPASRRADLLSRWKREYKQKREGSFSGHGRPAEITRLKKQLREAEIERDGAAPRILKKAGAAPRSASSPRAATDIPVYKRSPRYI